MVIGLKTFPSMSAAGPMIGLALFGLTLLTSMRGTSHSSRKEEKREDNKLVTVSQNDYPEEIGTEIFSRISIMFNFCCDLTRINAMVTTGAFFGDEGFAKLQGSFVVVVGLGGVGSHAANMLVRSGVGAIRLIDFDQVTLSSLNRHAVATLADVGRPKAGPTLILSLIRHAHIILFL